MILITGGFGFIGQNLARKLVLSGGAVALARHRTSTLPADLELHRGENLHVVDLDLREPWSVLDVLKRRGITDIVHLATAGWSASISADHNANVGGLLNLLEAAHQAGVRRVVAASSIAVYGAANGPYREDQPLSVELPGNGPGCLKRAEEIVGGYFAASTGLDVSFARIGMVFGPGYRSMRNLVSRVVKAIATGSDLDVTGMLPPYADYCHVEDIAAGLTAMMTAERLSHRIYNLGQGRGLGRDEMISVARDQGLTQTALQSLQSLPAWPVEAFLETQRAETDLGYSPLFDFSDGLENYVRTWTGQARLKAT